jgi:hypothetical protein
MYRRSMLVLVLATCATSGTHRAIDATAPVAGESGGLLGNRVTGTGGVQQFCGASPLATNGAVSECGAGFRCDDRGDGNKVCMGNGSEGAWCVSTADCAGGLSCRARQCAR